MNKLRKIMNLICERLPSDLKYIEKSNKNILITPYSAPTNTHLNLYFTNTKVNIYDADNKLYLTTKVKGLMLAEIIISECVVFFAKQNLIKNFKPFNTAIADTLLSMISEAECYVKNTDKLRLFRTFTTDLTPIVSIESIRRTALIFLSVGSSITITGMMNEIHLADPDLFTKVMKEVTLNISKIL